MPRNLIRQFEQIKGTYTFFNDMYHQYAEQVGRYYYTGILSVVSGSSTVVDSSIVFDENELNNFIVIDAGVDSGVYQITLCSGGINATIDTVFSETNDSVSYRRHYYQNLEDDLNYLRKMIQLVIGEGNWYDNPAISLSEISTSSGGNSTIGLPSDGDWNTGIAGITSDMSIADAIDNVDEILSAISPSPAGLLTSQDLVLSNTIRYNAKLANGLDNSWYIDSKLPGDLISDYVIDNTFMLTTPYLNTAFKCGRADLPEGLLLLKANNTMIDTYDLSNGVGSSSLLTINSLEVYNSIWEKANAYANITQSNEGYVGYVFDHTIAGKTNSIGIRYDNTHLEPSFLYGPIVSEQTLVPKYLSGVVYYGQNSIIRVSFTSDNLFNKCYHSTHVAEITMFPDAIVTSNQNPQSVPNYDDYFTVTDLNLILSIGNKASNSPYLSVSLYKPTGISTYSNINLGRGVCTYNIDSTNTYDGFYDENQRLLLNTDTPWISSDLLVNGNAQVRNGILQFPYAGDYPDFTGDQLYQRFIYKTSASTGYLDFENILYFDISAYGSGDLNVLIYLDTDAMFFDLGKVVGDNNGDGSGNIMSNSIGARISGSGSTVNWSIGTKTTANNNNRYRIIIIFRNSNHTITSITGT